MKLIYCENCGDVVRLIENKWRKCECKKSGGQYNTDLVTTSIGGKFVRVFGIANPFFADVFPHFTDDGRQWYRDKEGPYGVRDCWWGETKGDKQIFRIKSANGPRLKIKVKKINKNENKIFIIDKRDYLIDNEKPKFIITERIVKSSFKGKK